MTVLEKQPVAARHHAFAWINVQKNSLAFTTRPRTALRTSMMQSPAVVSSRTSNKTRTRSLQKVVEFLNEIGIRTEIIPHAIGFLPHVEIHYGQLRVDLSAFPGDVLHDAGHLACMPARWRSKMHANLYRSLREIFIEASAVNFEPDSPLSRALTSTSDVEATAWAWAAGMHLGIPVKHIINPQDVLSYDDPHGLVLALNIRQFPGVHGLQYAGFCSANKRSVNGLPVYPSLAFWLQP